MASDWEPHDMNAEVARLRAENDQLAATVADEKASRESLFDSVERLGALVKKSAAKIGELKTENDCLRTERNTLIEMVVQGRFGNRSTAERASAIQDVLRYWLGNEPTFVGTDVLEAMEAYDKQKD